MRRECRALMLEGDHRRYEKRTGIFNELRWWRIRVLDNCRAKSRASLFHQQPRAHLRIVKWDKRERERESQYMSLVGKEQHGEFCSVGINVTYNDSL